MRSAVALALLAGCATAPANPCSMATDHVAACTDEAPAFRTGTCDETRAGELLALDCKDLQDVARVAKADGWWDAFLCELEFSDHCMPAARPDLHTLVGALHHQDGTPALGAYVRLVAEDVPGVMRGGWTCAGGMFAFRDLPLARYRLEAATTPTGGALGVKMLDNETFVSFDAPIPK